MDRATMPGALVALLVMSSIALASFAACGGQEQRPPQSPGQESPPSTSASPPGAPPTSAAPGAPSSGASSTSSASPPVAPAVAPPVVVMRPLGPTAMLPELVAIGLDPRRLPTLERMDPEKLRKLMPSFNRALGVQCTACHIADDFHASTRNMKISRHMWNDFVRGLATLDGAPVYCDSCHQGRTRLIDRHDKKALARWMQAELVDKVGRTDRKAHGCETCHGDPYEGDIFDKLWSK